MYNAINHILMNDKKTIELNPPSKQTEDVIHNFGAGPSILPKEVFEQASHAILNFNNSGLSILEIGHRTPLFEGVMDKARSTARELMDLDNASVIVSRMEKYHPSLCKCL